MPVRVRECQPRGLLGSLVYSDVVGLSEGASREALLLAAVTLDEYVEWLASPAATSRLESCVRQLLLRLPEGALRHDLGGVPGAGETWWA